MRGQRRTQTIEALLVRQRLHQRHALRIADRQRGHGQGLTRRLDGLLAHALGLSHRRPECVARAEAGLTELRTDFIVGVVAPAATPKDIVDLLYRQIAATLKLPDIEDRLAEAQLRAVAARTARR